MLAPDDQLDRWQRLLRQPPEILETTTTNLVESAREKTGRWLSISLMVAIEQCGRDERTRERFVARMPPLGDVPHRPAAADGVRVGDTVWRAYFLWRLGILTSGAWLRAFIDGLAPTALAFTIHDNPEPWWQAEMIILHPLHSFALRSRDRALVDKTLACADFHLQEIQPDHATNEPWAVHAYASHIDGNVTAETLWHAAHIQHGGRLGSVASLLAREASASLAAWLAGDAAG